MKFRIIASIIVLVVVLVLTIIFGGSGSESTDQVPSTEFQMPQ